MNIALLGMDDIGDQITDDHLLTSALQEKGHTVSEPSWRANLDWSQFDLVIIRATWDYHLHIEEFLNKLREIDSSGTKLLNPLNVVQWNSDKRYLKELQEKGVSIVPTEFFDSLNQEKLDMCFNIFGDKLIVKPVVSANSLNTIITEKGNTEALDLFKNEPCLVQPFIENIKSVGEYSLYFFDKQFSHAIVKIPQAGDFRVQEDFGGVQKQVSPDESLMSAAKKIIEFLPEGTFYARVDILPDADGKYVLMELELIEPGMYFRFCERSAENMAEAIEKRLSF